MTSIHIREADLTHERDRRAAVDLINHYAQHEMGGGASLDEAVLSTLADGLRDHPTAFVLLAWEGDGDEAAAVGVAVCLVGFSSFKARPLVNIHDVAVRDTHRGRGIGKALFDAVEQHARQRGACKVTLEVRDDNHPAKGLYRKLGYGEPDGEPTLFWSKSMD
ncbi:MAG: GNAT family N-acetyltransferase [Phycisphaera sp.]|nr:GNAT family N-acetyltransferase [Phycisphaera sp.]